MFILSDCKLTPLESILKKLSFDVPTVKSNFGVPLSIPMMKPAVVVCPKSVLFPNRKTLSLPIDCRIIGFVLPILILAWVEDSSILLASNSKPCESLISKALPLNEM